MDIFEGLTEIEIKVVHELANKGGRSYAEIASAAGISERHLFRHRQKPYIKTAVRELVLQEVEDDLPDIMGSLRRNAKKGDFRSQELFVKMLGLLVEKREVKTTIEDNRYKAMSKGDIDRELAELDRELKVIAGGAK